MHSHPKTRADSNETSAPLVAIDALTGKAYCALKSLYSENPGINILTPNENTYWELDELGMNVFLIHGFVEPDEVVAIERAAMEFIRSRFFVDPGGIDFSAYRGLPLSDYAEMVLVQPMLKLTRDISAIKKAFKSLLPESVCAIGSDVFADAACLVAKTEGIACKRVLNGPISSLRAGVSMILRMKKDGWPRSLFKDLYLEPILDVLIIGDALLKRLKGKYRFREGEKKKNILFAADNWGLFLLNHYREKNEWDYYVFGKDFFLRKKLFDDIKPLEGFISLSIAAETARCFFHFMSVWRRINRDRRYIEGLVFMETPIWQLVKGMIRPLMLLTFPRVFMEYMLASSAMKRMKGSTGSIAVMAIDCLHETRALLQAAKGTSVKSLLIQHSILGEYNGQERMHTDYCAGWGQRAIEWFGAFGNDTTKIHITGNPIFDVQYGPRQSFAIDKTPTDLGLPPGKKVFTLITAGGDGLVVNSTVMDDYAMINSVIDSLFSLGISDEVHLAIKLHPRQNNELVRRCLSKQLSRFPGISIFTDRLQDLLKVSSICISRYSTVIIEAMFFRKPSIVFGHYNRQEFVPFISRGVAIGASDSGEMAAAIYSLLNDPEVLKGIIDRQDDFIKYGLSTLDGKASERTFKLINDIIVGKCLGTASGASVQTAACPAEGQ